MANKHINYETNPISIIITGFKQAFNKSQQLAIMLIVIPFVLGVVNFVVQIFGEIVSAAVDAGSDKPTATIVIGIILSLLAFVLIIVAQTLFTGFQAFALHKMSQQEDETFSEALGQAFSKFWQVIGLNFMLFIYSLPYSFALTAIIVLNIGIGVVNTSSLYFSVPFSVVAAVILTVLIVRVYTRFAFAGKYLFDGNNSVSASLEHSKQLTKGRLGEVFGVMSIGGLVPFVPSLAMTAGLAALFEQLSVARKAGADLPKQHILNYLVPALAFLFIGFITLILVAIYAATNVA